MEYTTLGRTGLRVSVVGLGTGGPSRIGQQTGRSEAESIAVVQRALDLGVNLIDTAQAYGTEAIVGKAIAGARRDQVILSTKKGLARRGASPGTSELLTVQEMVAGVDESLRHLQTDTIDIFHLHGVKPGQYDYTIGEVVPALLKLKQQGKLRWLGITESFETDTQHQMLARAVEDDCWDVMMVGFNMLNQSARQRVFPGARQGQIGVLCMFAVRRVFSQPEHLQTVLARLAEAQQLDPALFDAQAPLSFLLHETDVANLTDAAYRYCRYEPGIHCVLVGTGNLAHLEENVHSLLRPPLPVPDQERLARLFAQVDSVSGS